MAGTPVYSYYGVSSNRDSRPYATADAVPAPAGGMPYLGHTRCMANEESCQGARAKGTDYCIGHLRQKAKEIASEPDTNSL
jgi:hypothetical protein